MLDIIVTIGIVITLATAIPVFIQLRQHPKGMHILFFAEMWERFSYYGMRGILLAYMTQHFLFSDEEGQGRYGAYTSLVYLLPLIGGFLADKYLGTRKATAFGALLLVAGHLSMAIEQAPARQTLTYAGATYAFDAEGRQDQRETWLVVDGQRYEYGPAEGGGIAIENLPAGAPLPSVLPAGSYEMNVEGRLPLFESIFYFAMALIIMGVGFLKPNISTAVGQLYQQGDPRRDAGFTLYYFGINLGAFWASVLCAGLGATFGWWAGFGLAGVGMFFGWIVFVRRRLLFFVPGPTQLPDHVGAPPDEALLKKPLFGPINREMLIYICGLLGVFVVWWLVQREQVVNTALTIATAGILVYFIAYMIRKCTAIEAQRIILALVLVAASTVFFTLFELAGSALNQFAERNTDLTTLADPINLGFMFIGSPDQLAAAGFRPMGVLTIANAHLTEVFFVNAAITSGQTQAFNSGFILLFAPLFAAMWSFLIARKMDPGDPAKFALGLIQVGAGFLVLVWGAGYADENAQVPMIFLVLLYLLHTTGELFLSPVGLSAMTKLAPAAVVSTMMATWFLASSAAQALAAQVAKLTAAETVGGQVLDPHAALETYVTVFTQIGWGAVVIGALLGIASPFLNMLAHSKAYAKVEGADPAPERT